MKNIKKIWIISDTHFGHTKLIEYGRPENFEEKIVKGLKKIEINDILIHLGDVCLGKNLEGNKLLMDSLNYFTKKILIKGNHDNKSYNWYYNQGWDFVCSQFKMIFKTKLILFSHRPQEDTGYDYNIHGHFHDTDHRCHEPELIARKNDKQILISLEKTYYQPILLDKLI